MGVKFDRILDGFDGPFETADRPAEAGAAGKVTGRPATAGYVFSHARTTRSSRSTGCWRPAKTCPWMHVGDAAGRVLRRDEAVDRGCRRRSSRPISGVNFDRRRRRAPAGMRSSCASRRGSRCADQYGGSMPSGWTRWLLEQFEFPFEVVYPQALDAGNLSSRIRRASSSRPTSGRTARRAADAAVAGGGGGRGDATNIPAGVSSRCSAPTRAATDWRRS